MKKVSILLLLTVVLASFAFAIEGVGDFTAGLDVAFDNVGGANGGKLQVNINPSIAYSRSFGAFGLAAKLSDTVHIPTAEGADISDDLYFRLTPSYSLAAGPGELGFALALRLNAPIVPSGGDLSFYIDPSVTYGLEAGFGALSFGLGTEHIAIAKDADGYGLENIPIYFNAGVDLSFGLGFSLKPYFVIDTTDSKVDFFSNIIVDVHYAITDAIKAGVETDIPADFDAGVTVKPYGEFGFGALGVTAEVSLGGIGAEGDIVITPAVGVSYSF
jgi:hypothetical protein